MQAGGVGSQQLAGGIASLLRTTLTLRKPVKNRPDYLARPNRGHGPYRSHGRNRGSRAEQGVTGEIVWPMQIVPSLPGEVVQFMSPPFGRVGHLNGRGGDACKTPLLA